MVARPTRFDVVIVVDLVAADGNIYDRDPARFPDYLVSATVLCDCARTDRGVPGTKPIPNWGPPASALLPAQLAGHLLGLASDRFRSFRLHCLYPLHASPREPVARNRLPGPGRRRRVACGAACSRTAKCSAAASGLSRVQCSLEEAGARDAGYTQRQERCGERGRVRVVGRAGMQPRAPLILVRALRFPSLPDPCWQLAPVGERRGLNRGLRGPDRAPTPGS